MTTFSYTTGNPNNLTAGATASMNDIQGPFTDLKTFINGANIDTTNLATTAKPVTVRSSYETLFQVSGAGSSAGSNTYACYANGAVNVINTGVGVGLNSFYFNSAAHTISGLTPMFRVTLQMATNGTAPGISFNANMYPITGVGGSSGAIAISTVGTAVSGSTATITTPSLGTLNATESSDFAAPTTGHYALLFTTNGASAANAFYSVTITLSKHYT